MPDQIGALNKEVMTRKSEGKTAWLWVATLTALTACVMMVTWIPHARMDSEQHL